jgi:hypothetical protein
MKRALLLLSVLLVCTRAQAHRPSDSYLLLTQTDAQGALAGAWDIALRDLDHALRLDDGDGALTWREVAGRERDCERYALSRLRIASAAGTCAIRAAPLQIVQRSDGAYARLSLAVACPGPGALRLSHRLLAELDPDHRALVRLGGADAALHVVSAAQGAVRLPASPSVSRPAFGASLVETLRAFLARGLEHIFAGLDHVLFLLVLLLPTVLRHQSALSNVGVDVNVSVSVDVDVDDRHTTQRQRPPPPGSWRAAAGIRPVLIDVVKIVTAFTLAHSLTLSLAALDAVSVSADVIEPAIAASVALAALNNLVPAFEADRWALAFALGLLHGFGFSSALSDAGLTGLALLPALFGFNLGVELGQLAIVALFVPLAFAARKTSGYRSFALFGGSLAVLAISLFWLFERIQVG